MGNKTSSKAPQSAANPEEMDSPQPEPAALRDLSETVHTAAMKIFNDIDCEQNGRIDKEETMRWWQSNFARINTMAMFDSVDFDNDGTITAEEWIEFW
jgi:Ca2+-binding EF-hand superfamily protein